MSEPTEAPDLNLVGAQLRRIGHDLRGALGVLKLEAFSIQEVSADVTEALRSGDTAAALAALAELAEVAANLREATARGSGLADEVHGLGIALQTQPGSSLSSDGR